MEQFVAQEGLEDRIFFTGFMKNVPQLLTELDYFLMTSQMEGLGTSILDAFAVGLPVISTDGGGLKELVIHKKTGMLARVGAHEELASHLISLVRDKELRAQITTSAFESNLLTNYVVSL